MFQRIRLGRTEVLVPTEISRVPAGLWTHSACRPSAVTVSNMFGHLSKLWLRPMRSGTVEWNPPIGLSEWAEWADRIPDSVGADISDSIIIPPVSPHRRRFAMILLDAQRRQRAFVKWGRNPPNPLGLTAETRLSADPPLNFLAPRLLDHGTINGWSYTINEALPPGPHRPATLSPLARRILVEEVHDRLAGLAETGTVVSHGDFAPWNVRELDSGVVAVIDWEQVGPTPVASDELWHVVTGVLSAGGTVDEAVIRAAADLAHHTASTIGEAATFWRTREDREPPEADQSIARSPSLLRFEARITETLQRLQE